MGKTKLPVYKLVVKDNDDTGVSAIAFVEMPAIMMDWQAFSTIPELTFQIVSEEKKIVSGPIMVADMPIYRRDRFGKEYYVVFDKETIEQIRNKFSKNSLFHSTNKMHVSADTMEGVYMVESFITDASRGVKAPNNYPNITDGSWIGTYKIENPQVWEDVKAEKFKGFSVEGYFDMELIDAKPQDELDALANEIKAFSEEIAQFLK